MLKIRVLFLIFFLTFLFLPTAYAKNVAVNLVVAYKTVNFTGKPAQAIAINGQVPGPTLHFKEGDTVTLNVFNHLDKGTAIHWHGLIVPWQMDGVENISQKAIPPGGVFSYHFTLRQSGTYWYHAHAGFQEQQGLYGAIIIDPMKSMQKKYDKDFVAVLSDWSNTKPTQIFANLKKEGEYYSPRFPIQPSLYHFISSYRHASPEERKLLVNDYKMMQEMRMSIYDFSDVAYDAFLFNGQPPSQPWEGVVKVGDIVRLRFIGAAASTIFQIKIPGAVMKIIQVDGNDVRPYTVSDFTLAPGETYDVLIKIQKNTPYKIYAESSDTVGAAFGALVTHANMCVNVRDITPFPEPKPVTQEMMANMMASEHQGMMMSMQHGMQMPIEPTIIGDHITHGNPDQSVTSGTKYQNLVAAVKTNHPDKPIAGIIRMQLFGYMDRYIWFINGQTEAQAKPIIIEPGKRYRIIFTNDSMMHHPMHIHGHWFILRNGHGAFDPLMHTLDVPPGATVVADIDADASGQWFFHCHHLYHMMSGMSRVFQYSTIIDIAKGAALPENTVQAGNYTNRPIVREDAVMPIDRALINYPLGHPGGFYSANFFDIGEDPFNNMQEISFKGMYGGDFNKLELYTEDAEINKGTVEDADMDVFYWHLIGQFWAVKAGLNYTCRPAAPPYWQPGVGVEGTLPYFIDTDMRTYYHDGSESFDIELSRDTQLTNNFFIRLGVRSIGTTKTIAEDEIGSGLNQMQYTIRPYYRLMPGLDIYTEYEHDQSYGVFKTIMQLDNASHVDNTVRFGVSFLV